MFKLSNPDTLPETKISTKYKYIESKPWKLGFSKSLIPFEYHINSEG